MLMWVNIKMDKKVYIIGVGVGDSGLLTNEALDILSSCDVVIVPQSKKSKRSVALSVVENFVDKSKVKMFYFPTTNSESELKKAYDEQALEISNMFMDGKIVVYVTIGDVSIYSTFNYLSDRLKKLNIPLEIIPGIPSFISLADRVGVPLVLKDESFALVELKKGVEYVVKMFEFVNSIAILKIGNRVDELYKILESIELEYAYLGIKLYSDKERIIDLLKTDRGSVEEAYLSLAILKKKKEK
jgi:precorrin-2/cobalt-factor-2 C20-methyltransferase